jgi:hypothetical protein
MSRYTTPFTKRVVSKYGSVYPCYRSFFYGTLHMWARIDEEHNYKEKMFTFQTRKKKSNIIQWLADLLSHGDIYGGIYITGMKSEIMVDFMPEGERWDVDTTSCYIIMIFAMGYTIFGNKSYSYIHNQISFHRKHEIIEQSGI